jgi:hypothetical protein
MDSASIICNKATNMDVDQSNVKMTILFNSECAVQINAMLRGNRLLLGSEQQKQNWSSRIDTSFVVGWFNSAFFSCFLIWWFSSTI